MIHRPVAEVTDLGGFGLMPLQPTREWMQARIDMSRAAAETEAELRTSGDRTLKLAKDAATGASVTLRPGDEGYDTVRSASEVWMGLARDLRLMGYTPADFANLPRTERRA